MKPSHAFVPDLMQEVAVPSGGITSKPLYSDSATRVVLFAFDQGQELSEHTASTPAILQFLSGDALVTIGADSYNACPGAWAYMEANQPHSIVAKTPLVMLLTLLKSAK